MPVLGLELCDAGFEAALSREGASTYPLIEGGGPLGCLGLAFHDGKTGCYGPEAEKFWYARPKQVTHEAWSRLSHETSPLGPAGRPLPYSQLAYFFLKEYCARVTAVTGTPQKAVLAVPGDYLLDAATEEERIGLLLGMAAELKLPLAGIVDMAAASLCDPRIDYFDSSLPLLMIDIHLRGAELTLFQPEADGRLTRRDFAKVAHIGFGELLRHITGTMANRFLRHTTFDIQEDGKTGQAFYNQTKEFLISGVMGFHYQINTGTRTYELIATRDQLAADLSGFNQAVLQGAQAIFKKSGGRSPRCTVALTARADLLPGLAGVLQAAGLSRVLHLPPGAAAAGAARLGAQRETRDEIADVPVELSAPASLLPQQSADRCIVRLVKARRPSPARRPSHALCEGLGHALDGQRVFTIGPAALSPDLTLPEEFDASGPGGQVLLEQADGQWWLPGSLASQANERALIEAGDRLTIQHGVHQTEVLFAYCPDTALIRHHG
ncbi:hypothetical protein Verru16b_00727 [Lacunisphaera limnophila]|uniref:Uncharacterized protein n=1 Tax=Lacunisphaera limnophila TaxID=1838286 RepID=A0A1D8AS01_9BACT|nr:hypothetical protein [Lacunisphaera limnophila]AOS43675.1 hypothetical protein Verru16b_00727 [Lacunisphaera limnophila]